MVLPSHVLSLPFACGKKIQPKNKFNQSEKMWKQRKTVKGDQIIILFISEVKDL